MLGVVEKIQLGFSAFILALVLAVVAFYVFLGLKTTSSDLVQAAYEEKSAFYPIARDGDENGAGPPSPAFDPRLAAENRQLVQRITREQGVPLRDRERIERKTYQVPADTFAYIKEPKHWLPELDKAGSQPRLNRGGKGTMLEITGIEKDSMLKKFGFLEGDTIGLINGDIPPEFDAGNSRAFHDLWNKAIQDLESGRKLSVTVIRDGRPVHIEFKL